MPNEESTFFPATICKALPILDTIQQKQVLAG
jgi:hypothetical protein